MTDGPPNSVFENIQTVFFLPTTTNNFDTQHPMAPTSPNVELICWSSSHLVINLPQTFIWTREWCTFLHPIPIHWCLTLFFGLLPWRWNDWLSSWLRTLPSRMWFRFTHSISWMKLFLLSHHHLHYYYCYCWCTLGLNRTASPSSYSSVTGQAGMHWVHDQPREIKRQILQYVSLRGLLSCIRIRIPAWPDELWTDTHTYFNEHRFHGRRRRDHHHRHHLSSDWQRCIRSKITK